ncbi:TRAP transporter 4TM/12TM fusion protein [Natronocella acetinitrilica]|uniref:TRAP transporter 4TM/12TM fusion protein n=1 Tax=Natronocella acetinitrilica TaxID=414046 RepID=A0AAE3G5J8_9GAMM|nr:TRAP transporter fused permease subunit [Natronocella acetinitrilica]MCP1676200.1 TRAP transporter 4TM/12TM fusion protein [Natronocella acetinitrilica]
MTRLLDSVSHRAARWAAHLLVPAALVFIGYQMLTVWVSLHGSMQHYTVHLTGVLLLAAVIAVIDGPDMRKAAWSKALHVLAAVTAALVAMIAGWFLYTNLGTLEFTQPFIDAKALVMGALLVLAVLVLTWLLWGFPLAALCALAVAYFAYAHLIPATWAPSHTRPNLLVSTLAGYGGPRGLFRFMPLSADMIFLLLVYGGLLYGAGVIGMFADVGRAIGNFFRGGIAYSAIVASSLIGMVTGQAVSNIALSGGMTIPSMKQSGFTKEQAGAIEVLASTGSQLLPPIMGLGAFLMAEILGVAYFEIVKAAIIPGLLFIATIMIGVFSLVGSSESIPYERQPVDWDRILWIMPSFLVSLSVLVGLLYLRYSPAMAGFLGIASLMVLTFLRPGRYRPELHQLAGGVREGIRIAIYLALMLAAIGLVVQTLSTTGAGISLGRSISAIGGGSLPLTLLLGMAIALLIGMGLPTPAAYALIAIVVVPALIDVGLAPLTAHMFGFYFAIMSTLTPPIAVGVLTAMRISGGTFIGTTVQCFMLGLVCFLIPYAFVAHPEILSPSEFGWGGALALAFFFVATALTSAAVYGALGRRLRQWERVLAGLAGPLAYLVYLATGNVIAGGVGPVLLIAFLAASYLGGGVDHRGKLRA